MRTKWALCIVLGVFALTDASTVAARRPCSIGLSQYEPAGPVRRIAGLANLSGLTWSRASDSLFGVLNNPATIVELDLDGTLRRRIPLTGFHDTEGIAHVEGARFYVLEEQRGRAVSVEVKADTSEIAYAPAERCWWQIDHFGHNKGLEGIAVACHGRELYMVKEKGVRRVYHCVVPDCTSTPSNPRHEVEFDVPWQANSGAWAGAYDLAGAHFDRRSGHLLLLSQEARRLIECTRAGRIVSTLDLGSRLRHPEGVTMDRHGTIYVCGEPNELLVLRRSR